MKTKKILFIFMTLLLILFSFNINAIADDGTYVNNSQTDTPTPSGGAPTHYNNPAPVGSSDPLEDEYKKDPVGWYRKYAKTAKFETTTTKTGPWDSYKGQHALWFDWSFNNTTTGEKQYKNHDGRVVSFTFPSAGKWHIVSKAWCQYDTVFKITTITNVYIDFIDNHGDVVDPHKLVASESTVSWEAGPPHFGYYDKATMQWYKIITQDLIGTTINLTGGYDGSGIIIKDNPKPDIPLDDSQLEHELVK